VEYSVGVNSEKTFAVSTYYEVSNEIALRNYVNYARDLNLEIKKILQEKKAEFVTGTQITRLPHPFNLSLFQQ
jgi:hypothetical protein